MSTTLTRKSNLELLRIVAMAMIVIHHILIYCFQKEIANFHIYNSIVIIGVNLFVLISGYFGITLKWNKIVHLISITLFYSVLSLVCIILTTGELPAAKSLIKVMFPINSEAYWFVTCYFFLVLLSPIINTALNNMTRRQLIFSIAILIYINCFSSWIFQNSFNPKGYSTMQLLMIYCIGYFLKTTSFKPSNKLLILCGGVLLSVLLLSSKYAWRMFYYNDPIVVLLSVCVFCLFLKIKLRNKTVNYVATSMFAVYLIQESLFGRQIYHYLYSIYKNSPAFETALYILTYFIGLFAIAILLEWCRSKLFSRINYHVSSKLDQFIPIP